MIRSIFLGTNAIASLSLIVYAMRVQQAPSPMFLVGLTTVWFVSLGALAVHWKLAKK